MNIFIRLIKSVSILIGTLIFFNSMSYGADMSRGANNFYTSSKVTITNIHFKNIYGMDISATLFTPKQMIQDKKYPALIVGHPFRAVRQQSANLYATKMAEEGFVTLSFDQSFWGESSGEPRGSVLPDVYIENFSAAIDYLGTRQFINKEKIGVIGICASGGFSIAAAKIDPRIKALATVAMYNMGDFFRTGLEHALSKEERKKILEITSEQRYKMFETGEPIYSVGHTSGYISPEAKDSNDFYETERGKVPSNNRLVSVTSYQTLMNFYPLNDIDSISPRPILFIVGDKAPSRHYTDEAYQLAKQPKELYVVKDATRLDLYDRMDVIPWNKISEFFKQYLE